MGNVKIKFNNNKYHIDCVVSQWGNVMPDIDVSSIENLVVLLLLKKIKLIQSKYLLEANLKEGEFDVLATLYRSSASYSLTPTKLYQLLMITSGAMINRLSRLEKIGFVKQVSDESDCRKLHVMLTTNGIKFIEDLFKLYINIQAELLQIFDRKEQKQFSSFFKRF